MAKCPFLAMQGVVRETPQKLNLKILNPASTNYPEYFKDTVEQYKQDLKNLDIGALNADIKAVLVDSKDWWPADYGHYGPFMIRLTWHVAGTYRTSDGRGGANTGNQRFNPLDSWPDNGNLDKARRLLWPIKQKYGKNLSWSDLLVYVAHVAQEDMGLPMHGFSFGRIDCWASEETYWGTAESFQGLAQNPDALEHPLGAIVQSLIYVNPEGPDGIPEPLLAAGHIRTTFGRMAMNDYETVALVAGGHTFGKCHGAAPGGAHQGPNPGDANIEEQGFGWTSNFGTGKGEHTITSGLEGAWTANPTQWDNGYFHNLFNHQWELNPDAPGGAKQWRPVNWQDVMTIPDAHVPGKFHAPMALTTDLALIQDPAYAPISQNFYNNPQEFAAAYAQAWYKLTHRDMGPMTRYVGPLVPGELIWNDPIPQGTVLKSNEVLALKAGIKSLVEANQLSAQSLVSTAWASAMTFRHTDFRGGANGARLRLQPQCDWEVNAGCDAVIGLLDHCRSEICPSASIADMIVLGGALGVELCASAGGVNIGVPFVSGRGDATQENTDIHSFGPLQPTSDAFRNFNATPYKMVDRAHLLQLSAPEMAVLCAGMRAMGIVAGDNPNLGVLTNSPGVLNNEFFTTLLDMSTAWSKNSDGTYSGVDRATGQPKYVASSADLAYGSNAELRAIAERYAQDDSKERFVQDFVAAWAKVMTNDMYTPNFQHNS